MKELGSDKEEFIDSFKPQMPKEWVKNYNEWLSTFEIEDCLEQHKGKIVLEGGKKIKQCFSEKCKLRNIA